jgi:hypothetical protein
LQRWPGAFQQSGRGRPPHRLRLMSRLCSSTHSQSVLVQHHIKIRPGANSCFASLPKLPFGLGSKRQSGAADVRAMTGSQRTGTWIWDALCRLLKKAQGEGEDTTRVRRCRAIRTKFLSVGARPSVRRLRRIARLLRQSQRRPSSMPGGGSTICESALCSQSPPAADGEGRVDLPKTANPWQYVLAQRTLRRAISASIELWERLQERFHLGRLLKSAVV